MADGARSGLKLLAVAVLVLGIIALGWLGARWQEGIDRRLAPAQEILVYYATPDAMGLVGLPVRVAPDEVTPQGVLNALFHGPRQLNGYWNPIPAGAEVQWVQVRGSLATVSLNQALVDNHPGGSAGELLTVYSMVHTVTQLPGIERVQFLVEGQRVETLAGHLALDRPLTPDPGMILGTLERLQTGTASPEAP
ncbi:MAG TPA: GerMN domain-containing protein [Limnochorda sp.]